MENKHIKAVVKAHYTKFAKTKSSCCGSGSSCCSSSMTQEEIAHSIGYSDEEIDQAPDANLGLGCGNPLAFSNIREGSVVLDLGSGAGFDAFLAARKVGKTGKVIGVDITEAMIEIARENSKKYPSFNVEFILGDIENLPIADESIDIITSNCVINLAPNKQQVFREAYRVLKRGGLLYLSDIVLLHELTENQRHDESLIAGCVGGAVLKNCYIDMLLHVGFSVKILSEDIDISTRQYNGINLESIKIEACK